MGVVNAPGGKLAGRWGLHTSASHLEENRVIYRRFGSEGKLTCVRWACIQALRARLNHLKSTDDRQGRKSRSKCKLMEELYMYGMVVSRIYVTTFFKIDGPI